MIANENEQPIEPAFRALMAALAEGTDRVLNGDPPPPPRRWKKKNGFVLLAFEFGRTAGGRVNYISNADRGDMVEALRAFLLRANPIDETDVLLAMAREHDREDAAMRGEPSPWRDIDEDDHVLTDDDKVFISERLASMKAALVAARKAGL